jgi:hypothetical protein
MVAGRTLQVRCATWEQVEVFHTRKLRRGKLLSMKVPFRAEIGTPVTLGLELPNRVVVSIDGRVQKATPIEGEATKTWIEIELVGFTEEVLGRIKAMMASAQLPEDPTPPPVVVPIEGARADGSAGLAAPARGPTQPSPQPQPQAQAQAAQPAAPPQPPVAQPAPPPLPKLPPLTSLPPPLSRVPSPPPPPGPALPTDEHQLFLHLTAELRRLRQLAVHEVLGVGRDADAEEIRLGWMWLVRRHHPDLVARHHAPAITHLAEELTILYNRAYDRLRTALVLEGRATSTGSVLQQPAGWLVGFEDISSRGASARIEVLADEDAAAPTPAPEPSGAGSGPVAAAPPPGAPASAVQGGEAFETRARMMLSNGDADHAQEVLAAALCVYPRSRPLRSLYYVASALAALMKGERMLATSQLETALAHYEHCVEAAQILEYMRRHAHADHIELRRFFR